MIILFHYLSFFVSAAENSTAQLNACFTKSEMTRIGGEYIALCIVVLGLYIAVPSSETLLVIFSIVGRQLI
jgi:hypothetical protein